MLFLSIQLLFFYLADVHLQEERKLVGKLPSSTRKSSGEFQNTLMLTCQQPVLIRNRIMLLSSEKSFNSYV